MNGISEKKIWSKFVNNFFGYGYSQIINTLAQFVTVPFFLKEWGAIGYAEWLIISGIPVALVLFDMGVSEASANRAAMLAGKSDVSEIRKCLQSSMAFSILISIGMLLLGVFLVYGFQWVNILGIKNLPEKEVKILLMTLVGYIAVNQLYGPLNAWFMAMDRSGLGFFILSNKRLVDIIVTIYVLENDGNYQNLAECLVVGQLIFLLTVGIVAQKITPWRILGLASAKLKNIKELLAPSTANILMTLGQIILLQGGIQILNQRASEKEIVVFSMARTLMRLIFQIGMVVNIALRPELSRLVGSGNSEKAREFTLKISFIGVLLASVLYILLIYFGSDFFAIWSAGKINVTSMELAMIGAHAIIAVCWYIPSALLLAQNKHLNISIAYFASALIGSVIWYLAMKDVNQILCASIILAVPEIVLSWCLIKIYRRK